MFTTTRFRTVSDSLDPILLLAHEYRRKSTAGRAVDFDMMSATLNPVYATPSDENAPLEVVLEYNRTSYGIKFVKRHDLFMFQQALTGFEVVEDYME